jgi:flagellar biosynthesis protein FliR
MFDFLAYGTEKLQIFLLISLRAAGLFIAAPIIGHKTIPTMIKVSMAILLAAILIPMVSEMPLPQIDSIWILGAIAIKETVIGLIIGFFFTLLFHAVLMSGNIIGYQIGLLVAQVIDPESNGNVSMVGEFLYILATLIFLAINGHHAILSAFADSYRMVPIGVFDFSGPAGDMIIKFTAYTFTIAIKLVAPVIITLFLVTVSLGVIARTVPQMNIFIVGLPLKIGVGFLVLAAALPVFRFMIEKMTFFFDSQVAGLLKGIAT